MSNFFYPDVSNHYSVNDATQGMSKIMSKANLENYNQWGKLQINVRNSI